MFLAACGNDTPKEEPTIEKDVPEVEVPKQDDEIEEEKPDEVEPVEDEEEDSPSIETEQEDSVGVNTEVDSMTEAEAKEIIEYTGISDGDKLASVSIEGEEIKAVIELGPNDFLSPEDSAVTMYSAVSDGFLDHEGWSTLTVNYIDVGTISLHRSMKETNEFGMDYFPSVLISESLK